MNAIPTLGYRTRTEAVTDLERQGFSRNEIAAQVGVSTATVAALLCSESRRKRRSAELRTVTLPDEVFAALRAHAARRGILVNDLARRIVEATVAANLVDAVLDEGETL